MNFAYDALCMMLTGFSGFQTLSCDLRAKSRILSDINGARVCTEMQVLILLALVL